jgi:hypothetical protein
MMTAFRFLVEFMSSTATPNVIPTSDRTALPRIKDKRIEFSAEAPQSSVPIRHDLIGRKRLKEIEERQDKVSFLNGILYSCYCCRCKQPEKDDWQIWN